MDHNIESLLKSFNTKKPITLLGRTSEDDKAIQIMKDIKNKKIRFKPTNDTHIQIINNFRALMPRYERFANTYPLPTHLRRPILQAYNDAVLYGLIDEDPEKEQLKKEIEEYKKQIIRYREILGIQEKIDKPSDTFHSEVEEKDE